MKSVFSTLLVLFTLNAQADISGSSSIELDLPMTSQELSAQISSTTALSQSLMMTDSTNGYAMKALSIAYKMDKAELVQSMIAPSLRPVDLENPVLIY